MTENTPNSENNSGNANANGGSANQGGGNSQGQGGNQNGNNGAGQGNQNANQGNQNGGNQAGGGEDYKKKFGESTTENQRLMKILQDAGLDPKTGKKAEGNGNQGGSDDGRGNQDGAGGLPFFSDADLEAAFPSFVTMSDAEKQVLRNVGSFPKMARMVAEMHDKLTFTEQLEALKAIPENKLLADNEKEFRAYAYKDGNLKIPIEILANAFIGQKLREGNNGGNNQNNGGGDQGGGNNRGMERGTGGGNSGGGDGVQEMTPEAARELRTKDPRKYNKLAQSGKLRIVSGN